MKNHPGNESRKGSKLWAGPLNCRYQYIYLDFLNGQNCDFRTPNKYLLRPILLTDLPNSEFFKICRIISYWVTFNIYLLDYVPIKDIWSIFFSNFSHFIWDTLLPITHIYIHIYIWVICNKVSQIKCEKLEKKIASNIFYWYIVQKINIKGYSIWNHPANFKELWIWQTC